MLADIIGIDHKCEIGIEKSVLIVLKISRLSEGSTGQIFATSSVIYQIKTWGL